jgi:hypothetical protein
MKIVDFETTKDTYGTGPTDDCDRGKHDFQLISYQRNGNVWGEFVECTRCNACGPESVAPELVAYTSVRG